MPRSAEEIQADLAAMKAAGEDMRTKRAQDLRAELKAATAPKDEAEPECEPASAAPASSDIEFINDALAQLLLKGKGVPAPERAYSDVRSLLRVKHLLEDAAGIAPAGRLILPPWDKLGRDRDTGEKFKPGETQEMVDGLAQRGVPARLAPSKPVVTTPDGRPISFQRSRVLEEPEGVAEFVTQSLGSAD